MTQARRIPIQRYMTAARFFASPEESVLQAYGRMLENDIRLLPTDLYLNDINQRFSEVYVGLVIPAGSYEGFDEEVGTIGVPNFLLANESLDEELAYQVTRVLFEQQEALAEAHPEAEKLDLEGAQSVAPLELHPGARRYYEEASG